MGYRAGTRDLFSKKPREKGAEPLSTYMRTYKVGDQVDIVCRSSQQKGMPHKFYHGRTGKVWNVSKRAIGVEINKIHREKQIVKRIHVRVEHLRPSKSQSGHPSRVEFLEVAISDWGETFQKALLDDDPNAGLLGRYMGPEANAPMWELVGPVLTNGAVGLRDSPKVVGTHKFVDVDALRRLAPNLDSHECLGVPGEAAVVTSEGS